MELISEEEIREGLDAVERWILRNDPDEEDDAARAMRDTLRFVLNCDDVPPGQRVQRFIQDRDMSLDGDED